MVASRAGMMAAAGAHDGRPLPIGEGKQMIIGSKMSRAKVEDYFNCSYLIKGMRYGAQTCTTVIYITKAFQRYPF